MIASGTISIPYRESPMPSLLHAIPILPVPQYRSISGQWISPRKLIAVQNNSSAPRVFVWKKLFADTLNETWFFSSQKFLFSSHIA